MASGQSADHGAMERRVLAGFGDIRRRARFRRCDARSRYALPALRTFGARLWAEASESRRHRGTDTRRDQEVSEEHAALSAPDVLGGDEFSRSGAGGNTLLHLGL